MVRATARLEQVAMKLDRDSLRATSGHHGSTVPRQDLKYAARCAIALSASMQCTLVESLQASQRCFDSRLIRRHAVAATATSIARAVVVSPLNNRSHSVLSSWSSNLHSGIHTGELTHLLLATSTITTVNAECSCDAFAAAVASGDHSACRQRTQQSNTQRCATTFRG